MNLIKKYTKLGKLVLHKYNTNILRQKHPLRFIFWESTLRCCLKCKHCGLSCEENNNTNELSSNIIKKSFFQIAKKMDPQKIMIGVTGGEPLLRSDLFEIMEYAHKLGFPWGMVTNGFLVNNETIKNMRESGMNTIGISLDGLESTHNWIRNNSLAFEKVISAIKHLKKEKFLQTIEVITSINPKAVNELENLYQLCIKLKVDKWRIMPIAPIGRAVKSELYLSEKEMKYVLDFIKNKREKNILPVTLNEMWFCGPEYEFEVRDWGFMCPAGVTTLAILTNGDINGCPLIDGMIEGNVKFDNITDVWDNKFKKYRNIEWKKTGECRECDWFDFCGGEGLHLRTSDKKGINNCSYLKLKKVYEKNN